MAYKTPGVYIVEKNAFPNSVVEVATAVPAFIGYTEKAINKGNTLLNKPWRITSMAQYIEYFGQGPANLFTLAESAATAAEGDKPAVPAPPGDFSVPAPGATPPKKDFLLSPSGEKHLLFSSMQLFFQNGGGPCYVVSVGDYNTPIDEAKLSEGVKHLKKEQEPTMVVVPEAAVLGKASDCIKLQQAVLQHCGVEMKNRFAILDVHGGFLDRSNEPDPIDAFRDALGTNSLNFGAAYYPWLDTSVVAENDLSYLNVTPEGRDLLRTLLTADMKLEVEPQGAIPRKNFEEKKNAIEFTKDQWFVAKEADGKFALLSANEFGPAQLASAEDKATFVTFEDMQTKIKDADAAARANLLNADQMDQAREMIGKARLAVHQLLAKFSPLYSTMLRTMAQKLNRLPPSGAIAGLYTSVDNARGVWKAPANVSLNSVISPSVNLSHEEQEDLNVTTGGKSINAIRSFIGAGVLVWGARTLDGNSLDWRYVNVRRTMIMLEESLRLAMAAYVFEPNTSTTWVTVKSMATNFLTGIWKRGGLAGSTAADAFSVLVGLGETMTPEDILEGRMNVTILVALSRPAEFIEITFQQQMQKS